MKKALLVASTGGHLAQLVRLAPTLGVTEDSLWLTFRTPQSESLLAGRRVIYVPYVRPRDWKGAIRTARIVRQILRSESFDLAVSTGAAPAVAALPMARRHGIDTIYIESVSRVDGPSLSGRIIAFLRAAQLFTQHPAWADDRWSPHRSVFETYVPKYAEAKETPSLFVTLGTIEGFRFDAMIDAVLATGLADSRTVWQVGYSSGRMDLPGTAFEQVSAADFDRYATEADVVVSHAGVGSLLGLLDLGIAPVLVVRRKSRGEHVDDHQAQIARLADSLRLAMSIEADEPLRETLIEASGRSVSDAAPSEVIQ